MATRESLDSLPSVRNTEDAYASAANYLNRMGWNVNTPCFYKIELKENTPKKYLNVSAKKLKNKPNILKPQKCTGNYCFYHFFL